MKFKHHNSGGIHHFMFIHDVVGYTGRMSSRQLELVGNEVDRQMFAASGFEFTLDGMIVRLRSGAMTLNVLRRFEFDRNTMTMSCIVEDENDTDGRYVFVKGSFEAVLAIANVSTVPDSFSQRTRDLAREGFYTLAVAYKTYSVGRRSDHVCHPSSSCLRIVIVVPNVTLFDLF